MENAAEALDKVCVVVPCYRHSGALESCLEGLSAQTYAGRCEIIVVDSGMDPGTVQVAGRFNGVRVVRSERVLQPGGARNLGARSTSAEILAFTDADCTPEPQWLAAGLECLTDGVRLAGGPVLDALPLHPVSVCDNLLQSSDFLPRRPDGQATYLKGCNLIMRRPDFVEVGGFPDPEEGAGEDTMFCNAFLECWPAGIWFSRQMRVRHPGRTGFWDYLRRHFHYGYCRGALGLHLEPAHRRYGRSRAMVVPFAVARLSYVLRRVAAWHPTALPKYLILTPVLFVGMVGWALGFRRGLIVAAGDDPRLAAT